MEDASPTTRKRPLEEPPTQNGDGDGDAGGERRNRSRADDANGDATAGQEHDGFHTKYYRAKLEACEQAAAGSRADAVSAKAQLATATAETASAKQEAAKAKEAEANATREKDAAVEKYEELRSAALEAMGLLKSERDMTEALRKEVRALRENPPTPMFCELGASRSRGGHGDVDRGGTEFRRVVHVLDDASPRESGCEADALLIARTPRQGLASGDRRLNLDIQEAPLPILPERKKVTKPDTLTVSRHRNRQSQTVIRTHRIVVGDAPVACRDHIATATTGDTFSVSAPRVRIEPEVRHLVAQEAPPPIVAQEAPPPIVATGDGGGKPARTLLVAAQQRSVEKGGRRYVHVGDVQTAPVPSPVIVLGDQSAKPPTGHTLLVSTPRPRARSEPDVRHLDVQDASPPVVVAGNGTVWAKLEHTLPVAAAQRSVQRRGRPYVGDVQTAPVTPCVVGVAGDGHGEAEHTLLVAAAKRSVEGGRCQHVSDVQTAPVPPPVSVAGDRVATPPTTTGPTLLVSTQRARVESDVRHLELQDAPPPVVVAGDGVGNSERTLLVAALQRSVKRGRRQDVGNVKTAPVPPPVTVVGDPVTAPTTGDALLVSASRGRATLEVPRLGVQDAPYPVVHADGGGGKSERALLVAALQRSDERGRRQYVGEVETAPVTRHVSAIVDSGVDKPESTLLVATHQRSGGSGRRQHVGEVKTAPVPSPVIVVGDRVTTPSTTTGDALLVSASTARIEPDVQRLDVQDAPLPAFVAGDGVGDSGRALLVAAHRRSLEKGGRQYVGEVKTAPVPSLVTVVGDRVATPTTSTGDALLVSASRARIEPDVQRLDVQDAPPPVFVAGDGVGDSGRALLVAALQRSLEKGGRQYVGEVKTAPVPSLVIVVGDRVTTHSTTTGDALLVSASRARIEPDVQRLDVQDAPLPAFVAGDGVGDSGRALLVAAHRRSLEKGGRQYVGEVKTAPVPSLVTVVGDRVATPTTSTGDALLVSTSRARIEPDVQRLDVQDAPPPVFVAGDDVGDSGRALLVAAHRRSLEKGGRQYVGEVKTAPVPSLVTVVGDRVATPTTSTGDALLVSASRARIEPDVQRLDVQDAPPPVFVAGDGVGDSGRALLVAAHRRSLEKGGRQYVGEVKTAPVPSLVTVVGDRVATPAITTGDALLVSASRARIEPDAQRLDVQDAPPPVFVAGDGVGDSGRTLLVAALQRSVERGRRQDVGEVKTAPVPSPVIVVGDRVTTPSTTTGDALLVSASRARIEPDVQRLDVQDAPLPAFVAGDGVGDSGRALLVAAHRRSLEKGGRQYVGEVKTAPVPSLVTVVGDRVATPTTSTGDALLVSASRARIEPDVQRLDVQDAPPPVFVAGDGVGDSGRTLLVAALQRSVERGRRQDVGEVKTAPVPSLVTVVGDRVATPTTSTGDALLVSASRARIKPDVQRLDVQDAPPPVFVAGDGVGDSGRTLLVAALQRSLEKGGRQYVGEVKTAPVPSLVTVVGDRVATPTTSTGDALLVSASRARIEPDVQRLDVQDAPPPVFVAGDGVGDSGRALLVVAHRRSLEKGGRQYVGEVKTAPVPSRVTVVGDRVATPTTSTGDALLVSASRARIEPDVQRLDVQDAPPPVFVAGDGVGDSGRTLLVAALQRSVERGRRQDVGEVKTAPVPSLVTVVGDRVATPTTSTGDALLVSASRARIEPDVQRLDVQDAPPPVFVAGDGVGDSGRTLLVAALQRSVERGRRQDVGEVKTAPVPSLVTVVGDRVATPTTSTGDALLVSASRARIEPDVQRLDVQDAPPPVFVAGDGVGDSGRTLLVAALQRSLEKGGRQYVGEVKTAPVPSLVTVVGDRVATPTTSTGDALLVSASRARIEPDVQRLDVQDAPPPVFVAGDGVGDSGRALLVAAHRRSLEKGGRQYVGEVKTAPVPSRVTVVGDRVATPTTSTGDALLVSASRARIEPDVQRLDVQDAPPPVFVAGDGVGDSGRALLVAALQRSLEKGGRQYVGEVKTAPVPSLVTVVGDRVATPTTSTGDALLVSASRARIEPDVQRLDVQDAPPPVFVAGDGVGDSGRALLVAAHRRSLEKGGRQYVGEVKTAPVPSRVTVVGDRVATPTTSTGDALLVSASRARIEPDVQRLDVQDAPPPVFVAGDGVGDSGRALLVAALQRSLEKGRRQYVGEVKTAPVPSPVIVVGDRVTTPTTTTGDALLVSASRARIEPDVQRLDVQNAPPPVIVVGDRVTTPTTTTGDALVVSASRARIEPDVQRLDVQDAPPPVFVAGDGVGDSGRTLLVAAHRRSVERGGRQYVGEVKTAPVPSPVIVVGDRVTTPTTTTGDALLVSASRARIEPDVQRLDVQNAPPPVIVVGDRVTTPTTTTGDALLLSASRARIEPDVPRLDVQDAPPPAFVAGDGDTVLVSAPQVVAQRGVPRLVVQEAQPPVVVAHGGIVNPERALPVVTSRRHAARRMSRLNVLAAPLPGVVQGVGVRKPEQTLFVSALRRPIEVSGSLTGVEQVVPPVAVEGGDGSKPEQKLLVVARQRCLTGVEPGQRGIQVHPAPVFPVGAEGRPPAQTSTSRDAPVVVTVRASLPLQPVAPRIRVGVAHPHPSGLQVDDAPSTVSSCAGIMRHLNVDQSDKGIVHHVLQRVRALAVTALHYAASSCSIAIPLIRESDKRTDQEKALLRAFRLVMRVQGSEVSVWLNADASVGIRDTIGFKRESVLVDNQKPVQGSVLLRTIRINGACTKGCPPFVSFLTRVNQVATITEAIKKDFGRVRVSRPMMCESLSSTACKKCGFCNMAGRSCPTREAEWKGLRDAASAAARPATDGEIR